MPESTGSASAIVVRNLHLSYEVHSEGMPTLRQLFATGERTRSSVTVEALKCVVRDPPRRDGRHRRRQRLGQVNPARAIADSDHRPRVRYWFRRSQPALAVGAALKADLGGRRNIVVGALAMGLSLDEVNSELEAVIDFTALGEAIDRPMRTYSSGMRARLAFAIATMRTPEILLMDEALAVGDLKFRRRSLKGPALQANAGTVVVVSHNLEEIRNCNRALWLHRGEIRADGDVETVLAAYEEAQTSD